jgi:hypothetical protein
MWMDVNSEMILEGQGCGKKTAQGVLSVSLGFTDTAYPSKNKVNQSLVHPPYRNLIFPTLVKTQFMTSNIAPLRKTTKAPNQPTPKNAPPKPWHLNYLATGKPSKPP